MSNSTGKVGIDDMALYVPSLYFDIKDLAEARNIEYPKLNKGLGLTKMAITDTHEDAATMAANAIAALIDKNNLNPSAIGRIYLGTESALDGAKPTATYALQMLQTRYATKFGKNCFLNCDVVDMTFACIGAVDALQNTIDWVGQHEDRIGIVVSSDNAKYELESTGEYTQGAGAIALLVKKNPRLLAFKDVWGVATEGVHDFYKPIRRASKEEIIKEVLSLAGIQNGSVEKYMKKVYESISGQGVLTANEATLKLFKETPVFDGQYSNQCYQDRIGEAFENFIHKAKKADEYSCVETWSRLVFHLPYAFHAKRMFSEIYANELLRLGKLDKFLDENELAFPNENDFEDKKSFQKAMAGFYKAVSKTATYRAFVNEKIEKGQRASSLIGNMYTGSIFLSLMSTLELDLEENNELTNTEIGFFAYGSGSKSKVFEAEVQEGWKEVVKGFNLFSTLEQRTAVDYETYQKLHTGAQTQSVQVPNGEFALSEIGTEGVTEGARYYVWQEN